MPKPTESPDKSCALIGIKDDAAPSLVGVPTCAPGAAARNPASHAHVATQLRAKSYLKAHAWARVLSHHPNQSYALLMLDYIDKGVPILYDGPVH